MTKQQCDEFRALWPQFAHYTDDQVRAHVARVNEYLEKIAPEELKRAQDKSRDKRG